MHPVVNKLASHSVAVFVFLSVVQVLCATYFLTAPGFGALNSLLFLACGLGSSFCILYLPPIEFSTVVIINRQLLLKLLSVMAFLPVSYSVVRNTLDSTPVQIEYADMLPVIGVMCQRFLSGHINDVYSP